MANTIVSAKSGSEVQEVNDQRNPEVLTGDEYLLATLGYKQEFVRTLGLFESWAATLSTMNFVSGIPAMFGFVMITGGPKAAFANWTMVGGLSCIVSLSLAELAAALPTAGGIYYWSYNLGGKEWGPFLSWMTAWWNWASWMTIIPGCQQGTTNFLVAALEIQYPDMPFLSEGWFSWILGSGGLLLSMLPNIYSPRVLQVYLRVAIFIYFVLLLIYWIWFPIQAASPGHQFDTNIINKFYNGVNTGSEKQASDAYCWVISTLFGAWIFGGYDASAHLAEETLQASTTVARGIYTATFSGFLLSIPTLFILLICIQSFDGIISASYINNFAEYLVQLLGKRGAVAVLVILWIDAICGTGANFMSAQRVTYALSRDHILPFSSFFRKLSSRKVPVNSAILVYCLSVAISAAVIGSTVAFSAITATAVIAANSSYVIPIVARQTIARRTFVPAKWNLGKLSTPMATVATLWISYLFIILLLPQQYPVTGETLNYAPICIGVVGTLSLVGWFLPIWGARHWFHGPIRTVGSILLENVQIGDSAGYGQKVD